LPFGALGREMLFRNDGKTSWAVAARAVAGAPRAPGAVAHAPAAHRRAFAPRRSSGAPACRSPGAFTPGHTANATPCWIAARPRSL